MTDTERLDFLERATKASSTGISFDWTPSVEGKRSGFRFMRRVFIGKAKSDIRSAIDAAAKQIEGKDVGELGVDREHAGGDQAVSIRDRI
jgi:hypothetical protein